MSLGTESIEDVQKLHHSKRGEKRERERDATCVILRAASTWMSEPSRRNTGSSLTCIEVANRKENNEEMSIRTRVVTTIKK